MTAHTYLSEETMVRKGIEALMQALGPVETTRFLNLTREKQMDAIAQHRLWQAELDPDTFLDRVFPTPDE